VVFPDPDGPNNTNDAVVAGSELQIRADADAGSVLPENDAMRRSAMHVPCAAAGGRSWPARRTRTPAGARPFVPHARS